MFLEGPQETAHFPVIFLTKTDYTEHNQIQYEQF